LSALFTGRLYPPGNIPGTHFCWYSDWLRAGRSGGRILVGGEIFRTCPDRPCGPPSLLYNGYQVFPGGKKRPGRDADPSPPFSVVGHERVELYLYSPYRPYGLYRASVPVQGCSLPFSHFRLSRPLGCSAVGGLSMKNCSDTIRDRIRYLPACSAVTQPTAPP
jgi:hypothetical protein